MIICFEEKHGNRYVEGPDRASILAYVLSDRISDTYGAMFGAGGDDTSVWYDDETEKARQYLGAGKAEQVEQRRIQSLREQNPEVNWLMVGITTGKYSEDIAAEVYRTHDECRQNQPFEDTECVAIAALPESYWTTK